MFAQQNIDPINVSVYLQGEDHKLRLVTKEGIDIEFDTYFNKLESIIEQNGSVAVVLEDILQLEFEKKQDNFEIDNNGIVNDPLYLCDLRIKQNEKYLQYSLKAKQNKFYIEEPQNILPEMQWKKIIDFYGRLKNAVNKHGDKIKVCLCQHSYIKPNTYKVNSKTLTERDIIISNLIKKIVDAGVSVAFYGGHFHVPALEVIFKENKNLLKNNVIISSKNFGFLSSSEMANVYVQEALTHLDKSLLEDSDFIKIFKKTIYDNATLDNERDYEFIDEELEYPAYIENVAGLVEKVRNINKIPWSNDSEAYLDFKKLCRYNAPSETWYNTVKKTLSNMTEEKYSKLLNDVKIVEVEKTTSDNEDKTLAKPSKDVGYAGR